MFNLSTNVAKTILENRYIELANENLKYYINDLY